MRHLTKISLLFMLIISAFSAQLTAQGSGVEVQFREPYSELRDEGLASNVLIIRNRTRQNQELQINISVPGGWRLWGSTSRAVTVNPGDSVFVPVRLMPGGELNGNISYPVNATVTSRGITIGNAEWNISFVRTSSWTAATSGHRFYFPAERDTGSVQLRISNTGNADENFIIRGEAHPGIAFRTKESVVSGIEKGIFLPPGRDTIITIPVVLYDEGRKAVVQPQSYFEESYRLRFHVATEATVRQTGRTWSGTIDCFRLDSEIKVKPSRFNSLPVTAEFNTYNIASDYTYATLNLYGTTYFERNSGMLNYYYQTDFINNQWDWDALRGNYHYLGYFSNTFSVEAGNLSLNRHGAGISGKGLRGSYTYQNHTLGATYVRQPNFLDAATAEGFGVNYMYRMSNTRAELYGQHINNDFRRTESTLALLNASTRLMDNHSVRISAGFSTENHNWNPDSVFTVDGFYGALGYNTRIDRFGISLSGYYGSPGYTPRNGITSASTSITYSIDNRNSLQLHGSVYNYEPERYSRGLLVSDSLYNERNRVAFKYQHRKGAEHFGAGPSWHMMRSSYMHSDQYGLDFEYRVRTSRVGVFTNALAGIMNFEEYPDLGNIFTAHLRTSLRFNDLNASIRYFYGPYTIFDQMEFVRTEFNPQKVYGNLTHDLWLFDGHINLNTGLNYNYSTWRNRQQVNFRPELYYLARSGFVFSFYSRYMLFSHGSYQRETFREGSTQNILTPSTSTDYLEFGAGVKFNFNMPASLPKNSDAQFLVFQDMNGNGVQDRQEQGIPNVLVKATLETPMSDPEGNDFYATTEEYILITDNNGEVNFRNLPRGNYIIETIPLSAQGALSETKRFHREITARGRYYLPYSDGARVSGAILVQRDQFGQQRDIRLNNIRITAINQSSGNSYSSLTDRDGRYVMYLPGGNYTISINEAVIDERFSVVDNNINLRVTGSVASYSVNFQLVERGRTIRLAPANNNIENQNGD
ncbi:hypothetical protein CDL62_08145 [Alkalitalea saponilacus]|nr:hypothetical protein CDL62_08145 [Alkalitalea saponilacus]